MEQIFSALLSAFAPANLLILIVGVTMGIIIGALPGFNASMGVALTIPLTFGFEPETGLILLASIYAGAIYGGSITSILLHTPGEPGSVITAIDGYQMTKKGLAGKALGMAAFASWIGGTISGVALMVMAPPLSKLTLLFGPAEMFFLAILGLTIIIGISKKSLVKGLMSGAIGILLATVGSDGLTGAYRYTFDQVALFEGVPLVSAVIGLFSMSQVFSLAEQKSGTIQMENVTITRESLIPTREDIKKCWRTIIRSGLIGTAIGVIPGPGMSIASAFSWNEARRKSANPDNFGQGEVEGVAASEAGNNGVVGGSLIPLLTLGIPGNAVSAIFLGGLLIHGLRPGAELFTKNAHITYTLFWGFLLANFVMMVIGLAGTRIFAKMALVPIYILVPLIFVLSSVGSFASRNLIFDVGVMIFFGLVAYFLEKLDFDLVPIVLGLILGPMAEAELRRALMLSHGEFLPILMRPIPLILTLIIFYSLFGARIKTYFQSKRKANAV